MPATLQSPPLMPRKKQQHEESSPSARVQTMSVTGVEGELKEFHLLLSEIQGMLENAKEAGVEAFEVDGAMKMDRAKQLLDEFIGKAINGIRKAKRKTGG
jgi:hypothetical protein